ncbi:MAG: hypothetical protein ACE5GO_01110 [Anaerolineales bacterium]
MRDVQHAPDFGGAFDRIDRHFGRGRGIIVVICRGRDKSRETGPNPHSDPFPLSDLNPSGRGANFYPFLYPLPYCYLYIAASPNELRPS